MKLKKYKNPKKNTDRKTEILTGKTKTNTKVKKNSNFLSKCLVQKESLLGKNVYCTQEYFGYFF